MADDVKLEILLQAKNQSEQAFRDLRGQLTGLQQDMAKTAKAAESSFSLDKVKTQLLAAAGSIYGAYKTIGQAIDMAAAGSKLEKQTAAFQNLASAANTSAGSLLSSLKRVSGGMVAEADLIGAAGKAMLMNIPAGEITKLMEIAAATSKSTGQTITEAFSDITLGVARQSKMILDNLGIIVDVDKANQDYAKSLGKTSDALSDAEKRQAFMNAVMKSGEDMIKRIGSSSGSLDNVNKLIAAQSSLWGEVNKTVATFLDDELGGYVKVLNWIDEKLKSMRQSKGEVTKSDLWKEIEMLRSLEAKGMANQGLAASKEAEFNRRYLQPQFGMKASEELKRSGSFSTPAWDSTSWRYREGQWADYTEDEKKEMLKAREQYLKDVEAQAKSERERIERIWADYKPRYAGSQQSEAMLADQKAFDDWKKSWSDYQQRLPESQQSEAMLADQARFEEWKKESEKAFNFMTELSERTAESMQENFSTLFFDAYKGKLNDFQDFTQAVFNSILKAWSDLQGQMLTQAIFGNKAVGGTGGGGGLVSWLSGLFGGGGPEQLGQYNANGNVFGENGVERFASGGIVTRPTVFPFSRGVGLMGEAGPEAVMPLKRLPSGRLGVESAGGGSVVNVTVNNHTGQQVEINETRGPSGEREIEIMVGRILSKDGPATRSLAATYGLQRRGVVR
jgi:lambda family phage tail tape measure protein